MNKTSSATTLMLLGFGVAVVALAILFLADFSAAVKVIATIVENLGIGVGSVGLGVFISQRRRGK